MESGRSRDPDSGLGVPWQLVCFCLLSAHFLPMIRASYCRKSHTEAASGHKAVNETTAVPGQAVRRERGSGAREQSVS